MQILLANAKIMRSDTKHLPLSEPRFQSEAHTLATAMSALDIDQLMQQLDCSRKLAA